MCCKHFYASLVVSIADSIRFGVSRGATAVGLAQPVLLSQAVEPLTSVKTNLPSWL
jgi:hypothetical protein